MVTAFSKILKIIVIINVETQITIPTDSTVCQIMYSNKSGSSFFSKPLIIIFSINILEMNPIRWICIPKIIITQNMILVRFMFSFSNFNASLKF